MDNDMRKLMNLVESALDVRTPSAETLARKYGVSVEEINKQIERGAKVESEHTTDIDVAREIARDHIGEKLDYYDELEKVEENAPPGETAEHFITKHKAEFKDRYGKNWKRVLYATAWKKFG